MGKFYILYKVRAHAYMGKLQEIRSKTMFIWLVSSFLFEEVVLYRWEEKSPNLET